jgi:Tol biopolymer transport system component
VATAGLLAFLALLRSDATGVGAAASQYVRTGMTQIAEGGLLDWSADGQSIFYDRLEADTFYDVWRMDADGSNQACITCGHPELPNRNQGNPVLHPNGRYLMFQAEKAVHDAVPQSFTEPGFGRFNDLWAVDLETDEAFQLTNVGTSGWAGTLQPQFSSDGTKLLWGQLEGQGSNGLNDWALMVADWTATPLPSLANAVAYNPGPVPGWLEVHGWSADDSWIYFTCTAVPGMSDSYMDTCRMDFDAPSEVTRVNLTSGLNGEPAEWEDHSQLSPTGDVYAYISTEPYGISADVVTALLTIKSDVWLMNADGSGRTRITYFNEPGHPDSLGVRVVASETRWSPDGTKLAVRVQTPTLPVRNHIYIIDLARDVDGDGTGDHLDSGDSDGDGLTDQAEHFCGSDPGSAGGIPERRDAGFAGTDDDGDDSTDERLPFGADAYDCDGDGYAGAAEDNVFGATRRDQDACGVDAWPADFVSGGVPDSTERVTLTDLTSYLAPVRRINLNPLEPGFDVRWDLVPGAGIFAKQVSIVDLTSLITVAPRMLGGVRAFNGPTCPWPG